MLRPHKYYPYFNVGRKGSLVYYAWHDVPCVRSYTKPRNPRTEKQQANRNLHGKLTRISGATKAFRDFCFGGLPSYRSSHTAFIGIQMCQVNRGERKSVIPLQGRIRWGCGSLPGVKGMAFSRKGRSILEWESPKGSLRPKREASNCVLWIIWNAGRDEWKWSLNAGIRRDKKVMLDLPAEWQDDELFVWLLFYDSERKEFSSDSCLHVRCGEKYTGYVDKEPLVYTGRRLLFYELVEHWNACRSFAGKERMALQVQLE